MKAKEIVCGLILSQRIGNLRKVEGARVGEDEIQLTPMSLIQDNLQERVKAGHLQGHVGRATAPEVVTLTKMKG